MEDIRQMAVYAALNANGFERDASSYQMVFVSRKKLCAPMVVLSCHR